MIALRCVSALSPLGLTSLQHLGFIENGFLIEAIDTKPTLR